MPIDRDSSKFREGDFIKSTEGLIFDVKGLSHPPGRVISFVRYFPSTKGDREREGIHYRKVYDLDERFAFIKKHFPQYLVYDPVLDETMIEVPTERVTHHYQPISKMAELQSNSNPSSLEKKALDFVNFIVDKAPLSRENVGVSGSILVGLATLSSDLDLIIYGKKNAVRVDLALKKHFEEGKHLKRYSPEMLKTMHRDRFRESGISFEDYAYHELRKSFQGFFDRTEFFLRYIKDWDEIKEPYGESTYTSIGRAKVCGTIVDDSNSLFTPCFYKIDKVKMIEGSSQGSISGITSFRGRFCQQAFVGERILACGKLERVICRSETYLRLVLGNRPEDFMVTTR